jgi:hypothetical protein
MSVRFICLVGTKVLISFQSVQFLTGYYNITEFWKESEFLVDADILFLNSSQWIR